MNKLVLVGRLVEDTFAPPSKSGTYSLKSSLEGNLLKVRYSTIVHFASEHSLQKQLVQLREQSAQMLDDALSELKSRFRESAGETLRLEDMGGNDDLELISATSNSPRKIAYFRCHRVARVED